ncbi:LLM class flavin-dependent oxidoreductase [Acidisoma cellulosilytica]|uniref:LLM class flavin-dependent oxidoreductase n=1 Tax=Acidisoma cellulosilyticum TaxID=2802395 RepID=A0A963Z5E4_9PROT|nr:LLM class flavin-dependent oxidoreductase [Acidisoma cellulosilyticum]MCB8882177.1 LLM class flavin-dependent oxidoreductase [Acidisoma cellulosilyticum]
MPNGKMILAAFFYNPQGDHRLSWRHPHAPGREIFDLDYYRRLVGEAERAKIDAIFIADHLGIWDNYDSGVAHYANARLEPISLVSALAAVTKDIGFMVTASTSYSEPYNIARTFSSLDHISQGRIGWNVVTSALTEEAQNFGLDGNIDHARRYDRAAEFLDVTKALWDSWEDGAVLIDKSSGYFADPAKVHYLHHKGEHFRVKGPLNVPRSPQGYPVIVQAGSSEAGKNLAALHADIQFAVIRNLEQGLAYRRDMNERLARQGRTPESFRLLPGILPIVASSKDEALEKQAALESLMIDRVGIDLLSSWAGVDLSTFPLDGPIPALPDLESFNGWRTWLKLIQEESNKGLSIRQLARKIANTGSVSMVAGTAAHIADQMEEWFVAGAADGYNLMFPLLPDDWMNFMQQVVPELQKRGLFRTEYETGTLRDRLGLARPENSFVIPN